MAEDIKPNADAAPVAPAAGNTDPKAAAPVVEAKPSDPGQKISETKEAPKAPVVPEKYELKLTENSPLDASAIERIAAEAKAQGLSNEAAQKLLGREEKAISDYVKGQQSKAKEVNDTTWMKELQSDKEYGGTHLEENGKLAHRAAEAFGGEELVNLLKGASMNHNPTVFKTLVRIGKAMSEDKIVIPGSQVGGTKSIEDVFYPKKDNA